MERIDAHCHFWSLGRGDYGWLSPEVPALAPICRDFGPADMSPLARAAGIGRLVVVQAAPTEAETEYLLALAAETPEIAGVVGWADLAAPDAVARVERLAGDPRLRGLRPMLQDIPEDDWLLTAPRAGVFAAMERQGLGFDALVLPRHLEVLAHFAEARPELPVIVDHAAKPALGAGPDDPRHALWAEGMARLASLPQVHCKLSGLLTEMRPDQYATPEAALDVLRPVVARLLDWFGAERLIWGSDWPVLTLAAPHRDWVALTEALLDGLGAGARAAILGGNAARFYGLEAA